MIYKYPDYEIKPIELTPSILEKCGFVKSERRQQGNGQDWQPDYPYTDYVIYEISYDHDLELIKENMTWKDNEGTIKTEKNGFGFYKDDNFIAPCEYLHQLQNLYFSLTSTELEIKIR